MTVLFGSRQKLQTKELNGDDAMRWTIDGDDACALSNDRFGRELWFEPDIGSPGAYQIDEIL